MEGSVFVSVYYENNMTEDLSEIVNNSTTQQCELDRIKGAVVSINPTAAEALKYLQVAFYFLAFPMGLALNTFVFALIAKFKKLHKTSFYLILQVITLDLVLSVILYPTTVVSILANRWVFGGPLCPIVGFCLTFLRISRNLVMFVLTIDRLCTIFCPFWYVLRRKRVIIPLSIAAWLFAFVLALIPVKGLLDCFDFQRTTWNCLLGQGCRNPSVCTWYKTAVSSLSNGVIAISLLLYIPLLCKARRLKKKLSLAAPPSVNGTTDATTSALKQKHERRATVTIFLLFLALLGLSFPGFFFFAFSKIIMKGLGHRPPDALIITSTIFRTLYSALPVIDPIALMRNADVRKVRTKLFQQVKERVKTVTTSTVIRTSQASVS